MWFGREGTNRWDAPNNEYGVLYLGEDLTAAFAETFLRQRGVVVISKAELDARRVSTVRALAPLRLVDLTGPGLATIGADASVVHGNYGTTQHWALALWMHPEQPDGLYYQARHDPSVKCLAIFDRSQSCVQASGSPERLDANLAALGSILDRYNIGLI